MFDAPPHLRTLLAQSPPTILRKLRSRVWSTRRSVMLVLDLPPAPAGPASRDLSVAFADPATVPELTALLPETTGRDLLTLAAIERTRAAAAGELAIARHGDTLAGLHFIHTAAHQDRLERVAPGLYRPLEEDEVLTEAIFVVPAFRGRGVASAMLQTAARELAQRGYRRALAVIDVGNPSSLRAFAGAGFRPGPTMRVDRLRFGRRTSRFVAIANDTRRRYDVAVGGTGAGRRTFPGVLRGNGCHASDEGRRPMNDTATLRDQPLGDLVKQLAEQTSRLARLEVELATAGIQQKGREARAGAGLMAAAATFALLGLGALTACAILALTHAVDDWVAALIVGAAELALCAIAALVGRSRLRRISPLLPAQSAESVKEDVASVKADVAHARNGQEVAS